MGTVIHTQHRFTSADENGVQTTNYTVKRLTEFNGHSGLVEIETAGEDPRSGVSLSYERMTDSAVFAYGWVGRTVLGQGIPDIVMTTVFEPPSEFKVLSLGVGESYVRQMHSTTTTTGGPVAVPPINRSESSTETYLGQEVVTVPAGTFTTCKIWRQVTGTDSEVFNWVAKGSGLPVRDLQRTQGKERLRELLPGATINGAPVRIE